MTERTVVSDDYSSHGLPIGAVVTPCDSPEWAPSRFYPVDWYTLGGDGDEVAIDPRDLAPARV